MRTEICEQRALFALFFMPLVLPGLGG